MTHIRCREEFYPREKNIRRFFVSDEYVPWSVDFPEYQPTIYTSDKILRSDVTDVDIKFNELDGKIDRKSIDIADVSDVHIMLPNNPSANIKFNELDGKIDRKSFEGKYDVVNGLPRNPRGRTGIVGRGCLYYWGPNHAADPVVTTWKRDDNNEIVIDEFSQKPILKFVGIFRKHDEEWALPGGMVDPGELVTTTIKREFSEEALNTLIKTTQEKKELYEKIDNLFVNGTTIYTGYVDDPRNTDNAWIETVAVNFHDKDGDSLAQIKLEAGDDAAAIRWIDLNKELKLYASHLSILKGLVDKFEAHW